jgi:HNH endonuclease
MIKINVTSEAIKFHNTNVEEIFNKIITSKIGKEKLNNTVRLFLKKYKNILIKGKPHLLSEVNKRYENLVLNITERKNVKTFFAETVYPYHFQQKHSKDFLNLLEIDTCVYCNRNYTLNLVGTHARAELDHWFPKSEFPLLGLSFYNLIPSCHSCNHIKGSSKDFDWSTALENINHPYFDKNHFEFSYSYEKSMDNFKVEIKVQKDSKTEETLKFNKTKSIYNSHSEKELKDLLDLRYKYSANYLDILLNKTFVDLPISKKEATRMVFGIELNEKDFHKRTFSKFKKDILIELGIL